MIPRATYRLQLHKDFTFADAEAIVPYLADLGISHLYASPITTAARGSTHGYDVIDPTRINPELGGEAGFRSLAATLKARGMGCIIDIVPNHMGVAGDENLWWMDVLQKGRASPYAAVFDIDWNAPVALPVLGAPLEAVLAAGDIRRVEGGVQLYGGAVYPVRPDDDGEGDLGDLLARQHYRLIYWRAANDSLNWRRFFSINELAGVRVEDPAVFDLTHRLYFDLYREGLIDGVRVDHVDGLANPAGYCRSLRAAFDAIRPGAYIVVEKILAADEPLAGDWDIDGTSGYDFMREVSDLLHDPAGQAPLGALWKEISGRPADFAAEACEARRDILSWQFEGQLNACVEAFHALAVGTGEAWMTRGMIRRAVQTLLHIFPVYRTYGTGVDAPATDASVRAAAREAALLSAPPGEMPVTDLILGWLAGEGRAAPDAAAEAVRRFQQLSAPIAAKGVEDTAFYRHAVLLSANDVGFDPGRFAAPIAAFHNAMAARAERQPGAMLATATHDHKRGADARARLAVLSSIPVLWAERVQVYLTLAQRYADGIDPADVYHLLQALVGAWEEPSDAFVARVQAWQRKTLREAKLRSSWEAPDEHYEGRCQALTAALLDDPLFRDAFAAFMRDLAPAAEANSLAQTVLHYAAPGVPDLYQGSEGMDYSMVDPDNRRPVDYAVRHAALAAGTEPKVALIARLLAMRTACPGVFVGGEYRSVRVTGQRRDHVVAFRREGHGKTAFCAAAIRVGAVLFGREHSIPAPDWWGDTMVGDRPAGRLFEQTPVHVEII